MDYASLPPDLRELAASAANPRHGFFGPRSYAWRLLRENTIQLAGPYAAFMQIAHPLVAQGVAVHSNNKVDPIGRLQRTFRAVHKIVFGTVDDALEAAMHSRRMHKPVQGTMPTEAGAFTRGTRYHANRSDLLLWVHATLVEGAILGHERFIGPLSQAEKHGLYEELKIFGRCFGIPAKDYPATYAEFSLYHQDMVATTLAVSAAGREVGNDILYRSGYYKFAAPLVVLMASGMLPPRIRKEFAMPWNSAMALAFEQFSITYRRARKVMPREVLYRSAYLRALQRVGEPLPPKIIAPLPRVLTAALRA